MPLLPKGNNLDYNPDVITSASKKISTIQLENMKNPITDPDFATLSTLDAQKNLNDSMDKLEEMAGAYHNLVQRIISYFANSVNKYKDYRLEDYPDRLGRGRKSRKMKGGAGSSIDTEELADNVNDFLGRFSNSFNRSSINSSATPSDFDNLPNYAYDSPAKLHRPREIAYTTSGTDLLYQLIQLTRRMDILLVGKIKPALLSLNDAQIGLLNRIYQMVLDSYNDIRFPSSHKLGPHTDPYTQSRRFPSHYEALPQEAFDSVEYGLMYDVEYGDEIFSIWNTERQKLLMDLTVIVNSWKQNSPTALQSLMGERLESEYQDTAERLGAQLADIRGSGRKKAVKKGSGRNFYGQKINDSRDIPTIYGHLQDCPTKYLL